jgi:hypothetical protein
MTKQFSSIEFVSVRNATPCSSFARTAIADTAIAALHAAIKPGANSGSGPTNDTKRARKGGSIIVTASVSTGADAAKNKPA